MDEMGRLSEELAAFGQQVSDLSVLVGEVAAEMAFARNFAALAPFAERRNLPMTIGSELRSPHKNPHYRPRPVKRPPPKRPAPAPVIPQQRRYFVENAAWRPRA